MHVVFAEMGLQNIYDNGGFGIAITGLSIVFLALALISGFLVLLPRILAKLEPYLPQSAGHGHAAPPTAKSSPSATVDDQDVMVAIGFVLHAEMERR